jgi:outer membrane protein assembly factor BamB/plastocyanin
MKHLSLRRWMLVETKGTAHVPRENLNESIQRGLNHHLMHRRAMLKRAAGASAGALGATLFGGAILAQDDDATPVAGEETQGGSDSNATQTYQVNPAARTPTPNGPTVPPEFDDPKNWPVQGYDLAQTRFYNGQNEISTDTIDEVGLAWATPLDVPAAYIPLVANPIGVDGIIFLQDGASNIHALSADTGDVVWEKTYDQPVAQAGPNGIAVGYGIAVFGVGASGQVDALKTDTGEVLWSISLEGPLGEGIDMAPLIYDNTVYISTVPGAPNVSYLAGMRGFIHALDVWTGTVLWYFDTTTDNLWGGARLNAGGGLWNPPAIDENGNLYVGVANAAPYAGSPDYPNASGRPGDNDYANSLLRIDPVRGGVDWYINIKPHDLFDLDQQLSPVLGKVTIDGADVDVVFATGKHAQVIAANRETGEELWRTPVGRHENDEVQEIPDGETLTVYPGNLGGVETPFAFAEGKVFVALLNSAGYYTSTGVGTGPESLATANGQVVALDGATGDILWDVTVPTPLFAGATVINDVVFTGGLDGVVRGFSVEDGTQVFTYQASSGLSAPLGAYGDLLLVPAGAPFIPSADTADPAMTPATQLIALKVGGTTQEAAVATPEAAGDATPEVESSPAAVSSSTDLQVTAIDIAFKETELQAPADTDVTLTLTNTGVAQHDLVIENTEYAIPLLANGESASFTFNLPAGEYTYYCDVPGHRAAGMVGTLIVS